MMGDTSHESILRQLFDCVTGVLNSKTEWNPEESESACPSKKKKARKKCTESKSEKVEEEVDIGPPCIEKEPCRLPSQISPKKTSCYIKIQDPYAPCCCEMKPQLPPCPPKCHRRQSRRLTCGCDLCRKNFDNKCCDPTATFHS